MFFNEEQINYLVSEFMPRVKNKSKSAMIDVACSGMSILSSADKHNVTYQSLSKNLLNLKKYQNKITTAANLFPSSYLLKQNAEALHMAGVSFLKAKYFLSELCENLGGDVKVVDTIINLYLNGTVTSIFLNPNETYDYEWSFDHNESD